MRVACALNECQMRRNEGEEKEGEINGKNGHPSINTGISR